jgi:hypothetical protein
MIFFVIISNFSLTLVNLYLVWRLWRWRSSLAQITATLTKVERRVHAVLAPAPVVITKGEKGTHQLRERYHQLELQLENLSKIVTLLTLVSRIWQRQARRRYFAKLQLRKI